MRILILANSQRGLYLFRKELILKLLEEGHEVGFSVPGGECAALLQKAGCTFLETEIDRRGMNPKQDGKLFQRYRKMIRDYRPELLITYTIKPNIYGGIAARMGKVPYAANITGLGTAFQKAGLTRRTVTRLYRTALKKAKIIFFENAEIREDALRFHLCRAEQTHVLNGAGVNLTAFPAEPYPENPVFRFLYVGRIMQEKGIEELLEAVRRLKTAGEECILDIVGDYEEDYRKAIAEGEKEGLLLYHGQQNDVKPYYKACDCFVLPSWHEGMANTNLEAAATGRPIITSDIPGCREAIIEGESGLLCTPRDAESLTQTMIKMLHTPTPERQQMGKNGRKHMEDQFDKDRVVRETIDAMI